jgi:chromosome segregation ATPase
LDKLGDSINALPNEQQVRGWARLEAENAVEPLRADLRELKTTADLHDEQLGQLRTDVNYNREQINSVREQAARLRELLRNKGSRGLKKALKEEDKGAVAPAPDPRAPGPAFKAREN